ncbi:hypothetical protein GCM10008014_08380 [Paenibacillus silvae]|uniref:Uncharacterized protein n=1 Tax=Paenibacillus silvae TaxID=1325358 RepID=A0ABQ1Z0T2_9BACL|nr:hypothetical protein [Paenibacillus silvae]GGH46000.1 hypothetical protein GCM10008014_08380 [Paenibacillus silvae]
MIYHRKAETVRAIQIKDYSPATVAAVKAFTGSDHVEHRKYIRAGQDAIQVAIRGVHGYINLYKGDWLVRSELTGWCKYMDYEFKQRFEEGEHGQQSGDGAAEGL